MISLFTLLAIIIDIAKVIEIRIEDNIFLFILSPILIY